MEKRVRKLNVSETHHGQEVQAVVVQSLIKEELVIYNFSHLMDELKLLGHCKSHLRRLKKEGDDYNLLGRTVNYWIQTHGKLATVGKLVRALMGLVNSAEVLQNDIQEFLDNECFSEGDSDDTEEEEAAEEEEEEVISDQEQEIPEEEEQDDDENNDEEIDIETLEQKAQECIISDRAKNKEKWMALLSEAVK